VFSNSSVKPTDRQLSGAISLDLPNNRLGLNIVAYRGGGVWLTFLPAALIIILTVIATITLIQLRRHAQHRAETEEKLRAAYAFRQAMSQSLITGLRAIDLEGRITFVNAAFCRMTGFDESELVGIKPPYPYWPPEEFERLQYNIDTALAGKAPAAGFEMRIMRKNGERFDVRLYFSPLIDTNGQQIGWMASMNDITEPKRVRVELERAHERFETVIDGLDSAVHVADVHSGEILFANRAFQNIFGFDSVGRDSALVTAACRPNPDGWLHRDPADLTADELPCELFDGEIQHTLSGHWYHLHERAIRWVDGRTVRVQIAADITDRKHIDEVNLQQQKRLEQTSRLITMGEMASSLAHELNQPLSAIANDIVSFQLSFLLAGCEDVIGESLSGKRYFLMDPVFPFLPVALKEAIWREKPILPSEDQHPAEEQQKSESSEEDDSPIPEEALVKRSPDRAENGPISQKRIQGSENGGQRADEIDQNPDGSPLDFSRDSLIVFRLLVVAGDDLGEFSPPVFALSGDGPGLEVQRMILVGDDFIESPVFPAVRAAQFPEGLDLRRKRQHLQRIEIIAFAGDSKKIIDSGRKDDRWASLTLPSSKVFFSNSFN
jgi:PAS domain S-box-containing protein